MKKLVLSLVLALFCQAAAVYAAQTENVAPDASLKQNAEKGWFFYKQAPKPPAPRPRQPAPQPQQDQQPPKQEDKCKTAATWTPDCGFVDPGKNFDFQAKERDALMQNMVLSHNDPKAVENFQYYMRWVMQRAAEVTNLWQYNMAQNPALDPSVNAPVSTFGLRLMTEVENGKASEMYKALQEEGAMLIYFSRSDCDACHAMAPVAVTVSEKTGVPLWDASLDDKCLPGFTDKCRTNPTTLRPAEMLKVTVVPTLFLYIKPNTWIRLSTGVVDSASIMSRMVSFFSAYRNALLKGVHNGENGRASVDFSTEQDSSGTAQGVAASRQKTRLPSEADMAKLLGKSE